MPEIIRCPICEKETYEGLPECPHCGHPFLGELETLVGVISGLLNMQVKMATSLASSDEETKTIVYRLSDPYGSGYFWGYSDAAAQMLGLEDDEALSFISATYKMYYHDSFKDEGTAGQIVAIAETQFEKAHELNVSNDPVFYQGCLKGGQEHVAFRENKNAAPMGLFNYLNPEQDDEDVPTSTNAVEERLEKIKELQERDLISDEEAAQKRMDILDDI